MKNYYSNGKLLLTGEYLVLDGAKSLALPTKFGQDLVVESIPEPQIIWGSFAHSGDCWFEAVFDLKKLRLVSCSFNSNKEGNAEVIAETLLDFLKEAKKSKSRFFKYGIGLCCKNKPNIFKRMGIRNFINLNKFYC